MFVCAGESEQFDFAEPIGIGMVDAAIRLTRLCLERRPDEVIFVGTAGSYGRQRIFDIVESTVSTNIETGLFEGKAYTPIDNRVESGSGVSRETNVIVNSSNYITTDPVLAKRYLEEGIDLENMEFYGVLKTAATLGIPARGIFVVTNYCDANAHRDFLTNQAEAMTLLTEHIRDTHA